MSGGGRGPDAVDPSALYRSVSQLALLVFPPFLAHRDSHRCFKPGGFDEVAGFSETQKVVLREARTSDAVVKTLHGRVIRWPTGSTEIEAHVIPLRPVIHRLGGELGLVIHLNHGGQLASRYRGAQNARHLELATDVNHRGPALGLRERLGDLFRTAPARTHCAVLRPG